MKLSCSIFFVIVVWSGICFAQTGKKCDSNEDCIPLQRCPEKLPLVGPDGCVAGLLEHVCGNEGGLVKVCCAPGDPTGAVLPTQCGRQPVRHLRMSKNHQPPFGSYPWMVYIKHYAHGDQAVTVGVLVTSSFVLTSTTPVYVGINPIDKLVLGARDASAGEECVSFGASKQCFRSVAAAKKFSIQYEQYGKINERRAKLVKLTRAIDLTHRAALLEPICFLSQVDRNLVGRTGVMAGWDIKGEDTILRTDLVLIIDTDKCKNKHGHFNDGIEDWTNWICATRKAKNIRLDFGAPLFVWSDADPPVFAVVGMLGSHTDDGSYLLYEFVSREWFVENTKQNMTGTDSAQGGE